MDLFASLVALGRRWYLTLLLLVAVLGVTALVSSAVKAEYKSKASVIVLAPRQNGPTASNLAPVNSYLGAGTPIFANVVSLVMVSDATAQEVVSLGGTSHYTVGQGLSTNGPIINIEATSSSPTVSTRTAAILISLISREVEQRQAKIKAPPSSYITTQTVTAGDKPSVLQGSRTRAIIAVGAMGVILTFATVLLLDSWLMARARRRRVPGRNGEEITSSADESNGSGSSAGQEIPLTRVRP